MCLYEEGKNGSSIFVVCEFVEGYSGVGVGVVCLEYVKDRLKKW